MTCKRCGYCCTQYMVMIVIDPARGLIEDNIQGIGFNGPERCPHLLGDSPGEFSCAVHDQPWFKDSPCAEYCSEVKCNLGDFVLQHGLPK